MDGAASADHDTIAANRVAELAVASSGTVTPLTRVAFADALASDATNGARRRRWQRYWDTLPCRVELTRLEAEDFIAKLATAIPLHRRWRAFDFGCGFGLVTVMLAARVAEVCAWDSSRAMRGWTHVNAGHCPNVRVLSAADAASGLVASWYDLIVVNSVLQYMQASERPGWLRRWRALLAPGGRVVLSDVVVPGQSVWQDIGAACRFYGRRRRLGNVLRRRIGDVARYWLARREQSLTAVGREELRRECDAADLRVDFLPSSLTYRSHRRAAILRAAR